MRKDLTKVLLRVADLLRVFFCSIASLPVSFRAHVAVHTWDGTHSSVTLAGLELTM